MVVVRRPIASMAIDTYSFELWCQPAIDSLEYGVLGDVFHGILAQVDV
ncbi:hypothetical protein PLANPX_1158 [Lacipirellula parvula]|uniref:Uncharacterized protein n=1 Tax=Lacipirellula parvula TaxID=2650471 RepID=A0A5K7XB17_9BACT|nr:hypothetical protein PLANPX_1158 [Lacipirellula parvula]